MRCSNRRAISLLEILVSIFVLAVGLLSVASLITAGKFSAVKAVLNDQTVAALEGAMAEFRAEKLIRSTEFPDRTYATLLYADGSPLLKEDLPALGTFALDPLGVIAMGSAASTFPFDLDSANPPTPTMRRMTLRANTGAASPAMTTVVARELFTSHDELIFSLPDNPELPPTEGFSLDGSGKALKRQSKDTLSWLILMSPHDSAWGYMATFVVFDRRVLELGRTDDGTPLERMVNASLMSGGIVPNDTLVLTSPDRRDLQELKSGDWLLLHGRNHLDTADLLKYGKIRHASEITGTGPYSIEVGTTMEQWGGLTTGLTATLLEDVVAIGQRPVNVGR